MKNGVKFGEPKFHVIEEKGIVVCELSFDMQVRKHPTWFWLDHDIIGKRFPKIEPFGNNKVIAKARCRKDDTFDVTVGKRIAESRAKAKAFNIASRVWQMYAMNFHKMSMECAKTHIACDKVAEAELKDIETVIK